MNPDLLIPSPGSLQRPWQRSSWVCTAACGTALGTDVTPHPCPTPVLCGREVRTESSAPVLQSPASALEQRVTHKHENQPVREGRKHTFRALPESGARRCSAEGAAVTSSRSRTRVTRMAAARAPMDRTQKHFPTSLGTSQPGGQGPAEKVMGASGRQLRASSHRVLGFSLSTVAPMAEKGLHSRPVCIFLSNQETFI